MSAGCAHRATCWPWLYSVLESCLLVDQKAAASTVTSSKRPPEKNSFGEGTEVGRHCSSIVSTAAPNRLWRAGLKGGHWCHLPRSWQALYSCFWYRAGRGLWWRSRQSQSQLPMSLPTVGTSWYNRNYSEVPSPNCLSSTPRARYTPCRPGLEWWIWKCF